jgi:DNA invertase Pin-like site-specific DNA recombinase
LDATRAHVAFWPRPDRRGRKRAKDRGARFGRPQKLNAHQRQEALARREAGETLMDIARSYGVSHPTIMRL